MAEVSRRLALPLALLAAALLSGCGGLGRSDGAPARQLDPNRIDDAVPRRDPITNAGNKNPYTVLGKTYRILPTSKGYRARGMASWYGTKFHGESTANGERYDLYAMTAAHCTLPIPTYVLVTNLENGRQCVVRVNDRGPFEAGRLIDLSYAAATKLGYVHKGTAMVEVTAIDVDNWPPRNIAEQPAPKLPAPPIPVALPIPAAPPLSDNVRAGNSPNNMNTNAGINSAAVNAAEMNAVEPSAPPPINPNSNNTGAANRSTLKNSLFYVQAGAFSSNQAAENLRLRLASSVSQRVTVQPTTGAQVLYRVRVGPFDNAQAAEQVRDQLRNQQIIGARIVEDNESAR